MRARQAAIDVEIIGGASRSSVDGHSLLPWLGHDGSPKRNNDVNG
jgi:hypothetical protein